MNNLFFYIAIILSNLSCKEENKETIQYAHSTNQISVKLNQKIRFDFTAKSNKDSFPYLEINASIYNDNQDTVYFLTTSCFGEIYSIKYDTAKFDLQPLLTCNASFPTIEKIAPNGRFDFQAYFRCKAKINNIKLGFDFYAVDKSFDLKSIDENIFQIHNRPDSDLNIIWAEEKSIH